MSTSKKRKRAATYDKVPARQKSTARKDNSGDKVSPNINIVDTALPPSNQLAEAQGQDETIDVDARRRHERTKISKKHLARSSTGVKDVKHVPTPSDAAFEQLHKFSRTRNHAVGFHHQRCTAAICANITEAEHFARVIEQLAQSFLPILKNNVFDPAAWFLVPLRIVRLPSKAVRARSTKPSQTKVDETRKRYVSSKTPDPSHITLSPFFTQTKPQIVTSRHKESSISTVTIPSTFHPSQAPPAKPRKKATPTVSPYFNNDPFSAIPTPRGLEFDLQPAPYGLIQERIRGDLFALVLQAILWNQTTAKAARPVLFQLLLAYPTPEALAVAEREDVFQIIRTLGLQEKRTTTLMAIARTWVSLPPDTTRRYAKRNYPTFCADMKLRLKDKQLLDVDDDRPGWEIAHLPGIGPYALDSYRIFYRDTLWGIGEEVGVEPEWKRVVPEDKELRQYLKWKWSLEGWKYDILTGTRTRLVWDGGPLEK